MTTSIKCFLTYGVSVAALFCLVLSPLSSAQAGLVNFSDIVQSTQTPGDPADLFGVPDTSAPNKLLFPHPNSFAATATGAGGVDVTDSFLTFSVTAEPGTWATGISLVESGSWSLIPPVPGNIVGVRGNGTIRITEVNGISVGGPSYPILFSETFDLNDTPPDSANWTSGFAQGFGDVNGRVTAFDVEIDNRLFALSEAGFSFIDKKNVAFMVRTRMVPEPATVLLGLIAFGGLGLVRRR